MWGISWVPWGCSVPWGDIISTVGGYLEYHGGCSVSWCTWGISWVPWRVFSISLLLFEYPTVLDTPHGTHDIPHMYHDIPTVLKFQRMVSPTVLNTPRCLNFKGWYPPQYWTPHGTHDIPPRASWYPPRASWYPPTVLNIPHSTQDNPHGTHDIPHGTEHPHDTQDIPTFIMISPTVLNIPHGTQDIPPRYSWYPPKVLNTHHGTEHPPRYCTHIESRIFKHLSKTGISKNPRFSDIYIRVLDIHI